jgi:hypothetical protein
MSEGHKIETKDSSDESVNPKKPDHSKSRKKLAIFLLVCVCLFIFGTAIYLTRRDPSPIPKNIRQTVGFAVYYPRPLPVNYELDKNSISLQNDIVFFIVQDKTKKISISEQAAPPNPPDFDALQKRNDSFKKLDVLGGNALYGVSQNMPVAILLTNTTLVNVSGSQNTPIDVIARVTQSMSSLTNQ